MKDVYPTLSVDCNKSQHHRKPATDSGNEAEKCSTSPIVQSAVVQPKFATA